LAGGSQTGILAAGESSQGAHMVARLSKILLVLFVGLILLLVGIDNIIDYQTNFVFVQHVMTMDTVSPGTTLTWRAVSQPALHHAAFAFIIAAELVSGGLCAAGAWRLWEALGADAARFNAMKDTAITGLVCGFVLYFFGFLVIGGEWFQMWQSQTWNAQASAFRFLASIGLVLIFLNQRDGELA
jgi:predicted small integral membrane protein